MQKSIEELESSLIKYKNKDYKFGNYKSSEDLLEITSKGKIFVFSGKIYRFDLNLPTFGIILLIILVILCFISNDPLLNFFLILGLGLLMGMPFLIQGVYDILMKFGSYFIIGPSGILKKSFITTDVFLWKDIKAFRLKNSKIKNFPGYIKSREIFFLTDKKLLRVLPEIYDNREISSLNWPALFSEICEIYWKRDHHEIIDPDEIEKIDYKFFLRRFRKISKFLGTFVLYFSLYTIYIELSLMFSIPYLESLSDAGKIYIGVLVSVALTYIILLNFQYEKNRKIAHKNIDMILGVNDIVALIFRWVLALIFPGKNVDFILLGFISLMIFLNIYLLIIIREHNRRKRIFIEK